MKGRADLISIKLSRFDDDESLFVRIDDGPWLPATGSITIGRRRAAPPLDIARPADFPIDPRELDPAQVQYFLSERSCATSGSDNAAKASAPASSPPCRSRAAAASASKRNTFGSILSDCAKASTSARYASAIARMFAFVRSMVRSCRLRGSLSESRPAGKAGRDA